MSVLQAVVVDDDRVRLGATFDEAAERYMGARPSYPDALFQRVFDLTGLRDGDPVLEVGAGPGKATLPLAQRGLRVTAVEPGPALAARARTTLHGFPVEVVQTRFEDWAGPWGRYAAVIAATSWHWIDPTQRYLMAARALCPGGHLVFWSADHVFPREGDAFFTELQEVYDAIGEGLPGGAIQPAPGELPEQTEEIHASGLFDVIAVEHVDWTVDYDAEAYIRLLTTFSGHIAMTPRQRDVLFGEIRQRLAQRPGGQLRRGWGAVLHIARKRQHPDSQLQ